MKKSNFQNQTVLRKLVLFAVFMFVLSFLSVQGQNQKTDYTGTWTLNESKSQLGEGPGRRAASKMVITQDANILTNEKTSTRPSGEVATSAEKYNLDGTESDNSMPNRKKKSTVKWSADMKELTINSVMIFERDGNSMEFKSVEIYKLGSDGNSLVIESTSISDFGEMKTSLYYDKSK